MARGLDRFQQRQDEVQALGRELGRRSRSRCELCGERTSLGVVEVPPLPELPEADAALMVCARCRPAVEGGTLTGERESWRFLAEAVWAELPAAQTVAVRTTRRMAAERVAWATQVIEDLYLDPAIEARIGAG